MTPLSPSVNKNNAYISSHIHSSVSPGRNHGNIDDGTTTTVVRSVPKMAGAVAAATTTNYSTSRPIVKKADLNQNSSSNVSFVTNGYMQARPHVVTRAPVVSPMPVSPLQVGVPLKLVNKKDNQKEKKNKKKNDGVATTPTVVQPPMRKLVKNQLVEKSLKRTPSYPVLQYNASSPLRLAPKVKANSNTTTTAIPVYPGTTTSSTSNNGPKGISSVQRVAPKPLSHAKSIDAKPLGVAKSIDTEVNAPLYYETEYYDTESTDDNGSSSPFAHVTPSPIIRPASGNETHILNRMADQNIENITVSHKMTREDLPIFGMRRLYLPICQPQLHKYKSPPYIRNDDNSSSDDESVVYADQSESEVVERFLSRALSQPIREVPKISCPSTTTSSTTGLIVNSGLVALSRVASHNKHVKIGDKVECVLYDPALPIYPVVKVF